MLKRAFVFLLISSLLQAQQSAEPATQKPCPDGKRTPAGPGVTVNQRSELLRRGRTEDFAIIICSPQLSFGGCGFQVHPPQNGISPVSFSLDLPPGITVLYRKGRKYQQLASGVSVPFGSKKGVLLFRMKASNGVSLGYHHLHGSLLYKTNEPGKVSAEETLDVNFQFTVGEHDAKMSENDWPYGNRVGQHVKDVVLAPLLPFQYLLLAIACGIGTCDI
jgi:hypothetical protein